MLHGNPNETFFPIISPHLRADALANSRKTYDGCYSGSSRLNVDHIYPAGAKSLLKLVNASPNLERIMLPRLSRLSVGDISNILEIHPKLSHLFLSTVGRLTDELIQVISTSGRKLAYLCLFVIQLFPSEQSLKLLFGDDFLNITFKESWYGGKLVMMKRNTTDWLEESKSSYK